MAHRPRKTKVWRTLALFKKAAANWLSHNASLHGAALAFYGILSLSPLLVLAVSFATLFFDEETAREQVRQQTEALIDQSGADAIGDMLTRPEHKQQSFVATLIGFGTLLFGASGVFSQLKLSLNTIWGVPPPKKAFFKRTLVAQLIAIFMVFCAGALLVCTLIASTAISVIGTYWDEAGFSTQAIRYLIDFGLTMLLVSVLFAMVFKFLPDVDLVWADVWVGAIVTAVLFTVGKVLIGLYLGNSGVTSAYGAAGSLIAIVIWVYYSSQIFLFGAEFTHVYSMRRLAESTMKSALHPPTNSG